MSIAVPTDASFGTTIARFRLSTLGVAGPTGFAADGEVEDYAIGITDGIRPQVQAVADLDALVTDECTTLPAIPPGLVVTFDEPVQHADLVDSYLLLAAGPDADFSTRSRYSPTDSRAATPALGSRWLATDRPGRCHGGR